MEIADLDLLCSSSSTEGDVMIRSSSLICRSEVLSRKRGTISTLAEQLCTISAKSIGQIEVVS